MLMKQDQRLQYSQAGFLVKQNLSKRLEIQFYPSVVEQIAEWVIPNS